MFLRHSLIVLAALWTGEAAAQTSFVPVYAEASFKIVAVHPAPWADAKHPADAAEGKRLMGKTIAFHKNRVDGPSPLACAKPSYKVQPYEPDSLFEGSLTKPAEQAATLGFKGTAIPTLIPGCEIEFHFIDADTALFGLNDAIYEITRTPAAKPGKR